jgi:hypothetical protein
MFRGSRSLKRQIKRGISPMPRWKLLIMIWYQEERDRLQSCSGPEPLRLAALLRHLYENYDLANEQEVSHGCASGAD